MKSNSNKERREPKKEKSATKSSKKSKKTEKSEKKQAEPTPENPKKPMSRYNRVQKILGKYCRENDKHLGRGFNVYASQISKRTANLSLEEIERNIANIYFLYVEASNMPKNFPDDVPFYLLPDLIVGDPVFDGVIIEVSFSDAEANFYFKGFVNDFFEYFKEKMYRHLRFYYGDSQGLAVFKIENTDNLFFVEYSIQTNGEASSKSPKQEADNEQEEESEEKGQQQEEEKPKKQKKDKTKEQKKKKKDKKRKERERQEQQRDKDDERKTQVEIERQKTLQQEAQAKIKQAEADIQKAETLKVYAEMLKNKEITADQFNAILKVLS